MAQGEEEIIIIGGGKPKGGRAAAASDYAAARLMIDEAEASGTAIRFEKKAQKPKRAKK